VSVGSIESVNHRGDDPSFGPLIAEFAAPPRNFNLILMNFGFHETHIESLISKGDARAHAILNDLPYVISQQYEIYFD
jgi:hypothetical protein